MRTRFLPILWCLFLFGEIVLAQNNQAGAPLTEAIGFSGNEHLSERTIKQVMFTKESHWWRRHRFEPQIFQDDLRAIITLYNNRGFLESLIQSWDTTYVETNRVQINITISEGPRSRVGDIVFRGNHALTTTHLRSFIRLREHAPFSFLNVSESTWSIVNRYAEIGYIDAQVDPRLDRMQDTIDVAFHITEGHPVYVDSVIISGNEKTNVNVIKRELALQPGDLFTHQKVVKSQHNLYKTGLFNSVLITPQRDSAGNGPLRNVEIQVMEAETGELNFGLGYGSAERIRLSTELLQGNVQGTGQKIGFRTRLSFREIRLEGVYTAPHFFLWKSRFDNTSYFRREMETNYSVNRVGTETTIGRELVQYCRLSSSMRIENNTFTRIDTASVADSTNDRIRSVSLTFTRDTRDNLFNPDEGSYFDLSSLFAGQIFRGTNSYLRLTANYIRYIPLTPGFTLATKFSSGLLFEVGPTPAVPIYERFFAGGDYSLRGYGDRAIGPQRNEKPVGGYSKLISQTEFRIKLYKQLQGAVFIDAGNVWEKSPALNRGNIRIGIGAGLRYNTPLGMVRVDCGFKVKPRAGESPANIHLTLGQTL